MGFFRSLFGPSRKEIWRQLSEQLGGRFVNGGFWSPDRVEAHHREWIVTLDTYVVSTGKTSTVYTRIRAPYVNRDGFHFKVYRASLLSDIGANFGLQDIIIGDGPFDDDFIIQSNDESKVRDFLSNPRIREIIHFQPRIIFMVKQDQGWFNQQYPDGVDELYFQSVGVIKDVVQLESLFELFAESLDQLCRIGSAYRDAPPDA